ncbi:MAG: DNA polymerase III subunit delta [Hyphomicrobiaceae bacterium]|nr:DNA polymerase III subunit delta [Hyphomicrobiaceae bacterium]MCC0024286.1 DNA polymerase III subunit delta [Hyphomicrobiaceae bacterium]
MSALKAHEVDRFLAGKSLPVALYLVYGPDAGLVSERARNISNHFVSEAGGSMNLATFEMSELDGDPGLLAREARTPSLFGGNPLIRVRNVSGKIVPLLEELLADWPDAGLILESGNLTPKDKLRALAEKSDKAYALPCYADSEADLARLISETFDGEAIRIDAEAAAMLRTSLGNDREVTRRELEKLVLYAQDSKELTIGDILALSGDNATIAIDQVLDAAAIGHLEKLDRALGRALTQGIDAARILRAALNHFLFLRQVLAEANDKGQRPADLLDPRRHRFHFSRTNALKTQVRLWDLKSLSEAIQRLQDASRKQRTARETGDAIAGRVLVALASRVSKR